MAEFYKNTYPTAADNISAGYPLGSFWNNMVSYDVYEHVTDGEWYWRKQDGMLANVEIPEQLNKTSSIPELDSMITGLTNRVEILEDSALDVLYAEYWGVGNTLPAPSESGIYAITYPVGEANPLKVTKVYVSTSGLQWSELVGYLTDKNSRNRVYINRNTNLQYSWSGSVMVALTVPLVFASQSDAETGTNDNKVMSALTTLQSFVYQIVNKTFSGLTTTTKTIQGAINEVWDGIFNRAPRVIAVTGTTIDLTTGEIFTKTLTGATTFTITNPINYKPFKIKLNGGSLNTPIFSGYTETFIASTLRTDYVSAGSVLYCEIQSANNINLFWGE